MQSQRVVIVTGAAGGMGSAMVARFLSNGDRVVATDLPDTGLDNLDANGGELATVAGDVADESDCGRIAGVARDRFGRVDVLVHAAGHFPVTPFEQMSSDEWRRVVDVNLTGGFLMAKAVLPLMKGRGWGRIVFIGSASVFEGVPGQCHYVAAKSGVIGLARSLAMEVGEYGITVNVVAPGLTMTPPVADGPLKDLAPGQREARAIGRDEQAEDLVGPVFFLASSDADFMSGQTLCVDGGKAKH